MLNSPCVFSSFLALIPRTQSCEDTLYHVFKGTLLLALLRTFSPSLSLHLKDASLSCYSWSEETESAM